MSLLVWLPLNGDATNKGIKQNLSLQTVGSGGFTDDEEFGPVARFPNSSASYMYMPGLKLQTGSWSAWIRVLGEGSSSSQRILSEGRDTGSIGTNIWVSKAGTTLYCSTHKKTLSTSCSLGTWMHICLTFGSGVIALYKDSVLVATTSYTEDSDYAQSNDVFVLGKMAYSYTSTSSYFPFNGYISDVQLYDHVLSKLEIREIWQRLVLHYKFTGVNDEYNTYWDTNSTGYFNYRGYANGIKTAQNAPRYNIGADFVDSEQGFNAIGWEVPDKYYDIGSEFTFDKKIKAHTLTFWCGFDNWQQILHEGQTMQQVCEWNNGTILIDQNNLLLKMRDTASVFTTWNLIPTGELTPGWHFFALIFENQNLGFYIDGQEYDAITIENEDMETFFDLTYGVYVSDTNIG